MFEIAIRKQLGAFTLDVELSAPENQIVVLFGPSGAGKSMALATIAGLASPDAGRIVAGERVLFDSQRHINLAPQERRIGFVKQDLALFPHLTAEQNIAYGLLRESANAKRERVRELARLMNLDDFIQRHPAQLSGGQQQRVALARAIAPRPDILLLDEPFSALDTPMRMELRHQVLELQRAFRIPTLFVTHDLGEAYFLADRLAIIDQGKILQTDTPGEILRRPCCLQAARVIGVKNILPGVIAACDENGCRVQVGDVMLDAPPHSFELHTPVHVCVRPERVMLLRPERTGKSNVENMLEGTIVRETSDGMNATLFIRLSDARLMHEQDYDLQIELPVYIYERLGLAHQRQWAVSLRKNAIHLIP